MIPGYRKRNKKAKIYEGNPEDKYSSASVFTKAEIHQILEAWYIEGTHNYAGLGERFGGVAGLTIRLIVEGHSYKRWVNAWKADNGVSE